MIAKTRNFFSEVKVELQKASWPWEPKEKGIRRYKELTDSTLVVIIAMLLLGGYVAFFDFILVNVIHFFTRIALIMAQTLAAKDQWFVVHVLSGQENKVHDNITKRVKTEEMSDVIYEVLVPTERVSEIKKGKKSETTRKFFPGYLIVNMHLLDENNQLVGRTWYFIRDTPGVIGFAGTKDKPIPMRQSEVDSMLAQMKEREEKVKPKVSFEVGETVKVADGPFQNQNGIVEEIDPERGKLRVSVTIFGRATPVELEYWQVERG